MVERAARETMKSDLVAVRLWRAKLEDGGEIKCKEGIF
jgi:hypothetical protein